METLSVIDGVSDCHRITPTHSKYIYYGGRPEINGEGITHVVVSPTVVAITDVAFYGWSDLQVVEIPDSVKVIGIKAFRNCTSLSSIHLPGSIVSIGYGAFYGCINLSRINLPTSIVCIGAYAFGHCTSITSIVIPPSITIIEPFTFKWCSSMSKVVIPSSVRHVRINAFRFCKSLVSLKLPNSLQLIDGWAFAGCISLASIHVPSSTTTIGTNAFFRCVALEIIYIPTDTIIAKDAFSQCPDDMIILTDDDRKIVFDDYLSLSLQTIHEYIHDIPYDLQPRQQMVALEKVMHQLKSHSAHAHHQVHRYRITNFVYDYLSPIFQILGQVLGLVLTFMIVTDIEKDMPYESMNLLHLLTYYPEDTYQPLSDLLTKCPQAIEAVDKNGKTPMDHVIASTEHVLKIKTYELLIEHTSVQETLQTIHRAIASGSSWDEIKDILKVKSSVLACQDEKTGLLPFMMAAQSEELDVNAVYHMFSSQPDVLKMYCNF